MKGRRTIATGAVGAFNSIERSEPISVAVALAGLGVERKENPLRDEREN